MEDRLFRLFLFRLIPVLMLVSFVAWWSSAGTHRAAGGAPDLAAELVDLFSSSALIDGPVQAEQLAAIAKKVGPAGMNRLLYESAGGASLPALRWMVTHGADVHNIGSVEGQPLLHRVAARPQYERLEYFLSLRLDPLRRSTDGRTLMHVCAQAGMDERTLSLLISKGLSVDDANHSGKRPVHFASVKSVAVLAQAGADLAAQDDEGRTALHWAALEGRHEIVSELLRFNASVYVTDKQGRTPLHLAAMKRSEATVDALLAAGALKTPRDVNGLTPRALAEAADRQQRYRNERERLAEKL